MAEAPAAVGEVPRAAVQTEPAAAAGACVRAALERLRLAQYADKLVDELGWDDLGFLRSKSTERRVEIGARCGMKEGHAEKFAELL